MANKKLHPSVEQFKMFVKANPKIMEEVKTGKKTLQELYEDWYLLGEEDSRWDSLLTGTKSETAPEENGKKTDWLGTIMGTIKKVDPNEMQGYVNNLSKALAAVQGVISQFQGGGTVNTKVTETKLSNPFVFKKD
ncbi:YlbD family protein [Cytobacillus massiliigabonensis]|uniref:YlbD family protein n=1 Tax=Cytobacillus massiliigabonensis TaxID=1871011 RepID=UPI000C8165B7|nr:YlbD family protein [Cytobacillus massiliigabonensis]